MTDNLSYAWRNKPLGDVMPKSRLLDNLERAGYITAGDVMDVDAETLAADVKGVGPKRAAMIRDDVFEDAKLMSRLDDAEIERVYPSRPESIYGDDATTPALNDTLMTIAALLGVALMVYMLARMVL
jgi:hypothetical protein